MGGVWYVGMWKDGKDWYLHETSWRSTRKLGDLGMKMNFNIFKKFDNYTAVGSGAEKQPCFQCFLSTL